MNNKMITIYSTLFFSLFFLNACSGSGNDANPDGSDNPVDKDLVFYVSPTGQGSEDGESKDDAANFLDDSFWGLIKKKVMKTSITIQFLPGEYGESITKKPLIFEKMGSPDYNLTLKGGKDVVFSLKDRVRKIDYAIRISGSQNLIIDDFHFTGNGLVGYVIKINKLSESNIPTENITIQNCSFIDMKGIIYGASGCHSETTQHITYKNCTFKRIGIDSHSHFLYNSWGANHINVIDCHFEDCTGDYIRFRDHCDFILVKGCTFRKTTHEYFTGVAFIMFPQFNNVNPGDEWFATNFSFVNNKFINISSKDINAMSFYHGGFDYPGMHYLLSRQEGEILTSGTPAQKKRLLLDNFGINSDSVRINGNTFSSHIKRHFALQTYAKYGAKSKGFEGVGDITETINTQSTPFNWELE